MKKIITIYEDEHIIVLNKHANTLCIPDRYEPKKFNLKSYLQKLYGNIFVVHRLDKDTSGVVCFAKTKEAHRDLSLQFQNRKVVKIYHLFCEGHPRLDNGRIDQPLLQTADGKGIIHNKGKVSRTKFKLIKAFRFHCLLEFELLTGRTHQARIHSAHINCPLMVDPLYGNRELFFLSEIKRNYKTGKNKEERPFLRRTPLHAWHLAINHPITSKRLYFEAKYPKDLKALEKQLTKWSS